MIYWPPSPRSIGGWIDAEGAPRHRGPEVKINMARQGSASPGVGDDTLMSRADTSGGMAGTSQWKSPSPPISLCKPGMQFINHSASDAHSLRRAAGGTAVGPSGC